MKTNCWFNRKSSRRPAVAGLLIPLLLACFAAVFISAPIPAVAGETVPFNGTVSGQIPSDLGPPDETGCVFDFLVSNSGIATELGAFTGYAEFIPNLCDLTYTGFFYWTAANGDQISGPFSGYLTSTATAGVFDNHETAIVTDGTGRFAGATGIFALTGQVNFITSSFVLPWKGTISSVGSKPKP